MPKSDAGSTLDRSLTLEIVRVTEQAAIAAARLRGRGNEMAADQAAVDAMRRELNRLMIKGRVVIGEGERDEAPMLFIGEEVGTGNGPRVEPQLEQRVRERTSFVERRFDDPRREKMRIRFPAEIFAHLLFEDGLEPRSRMKPNTNPPEKFR